MADLAAWRRERMPVLPNVAAFRIVDPLARTLEIYRLEVDRWVVASPHGGSERVRPEPFDAVELEIARWWLES